LLIRPALTHHDKPPSVVPKVVEAKDFQQLKSGLELYGNAGVNTSVSQSLLPYPLQQYSVGAACAQSGDICLFVAKKERPTPGCASVGTYMSLQPNAEVEALARSTLEKLNYFGIAEVEILRREDTGELYVIEINARPWLQYMLALRSGHDFLRFLLDNDNFQPDRARKAGYRWIDFNSDFFTAFSKSIGLVRNGDVSLQTYVTSLIRANVYARFDLRDLKPFRLGLSELRKLVK
jgi:predicted ATP-grasp superfamily ATP-dependent carboligase